MDQKLRNFKLVRKLELKKGTRVKITRGDHKNQIGTVKGLIKGKLVFDQILNLKSTRKTYKVKIDQSNVSKIK